MVVTEGRRLEGSRGVRKHEMERDVDDEGDRGGV